MEKRTILIIEDDPHIREIYSMMLTMEGYDVMEAENGQVGLDMLRDCHSKSMPHCIILDITMPVMNGEKFLSTIDSNHKETFGNIFNDCIYSYSRAGRTNVRQSLSLKYVRRDLLTRLVSSLILICVFSYFKQFYRYCFAVICLPFISCIRSAND